MPGCCNDAVSHCVAELDVKSCYYDAAAQKNSWADLKVTPMEEAFLMTKESFQCDDAENDDGLLTKRFLPCMPPTLLLPNLSIATFMKNTPHIIK